MAFLDLVDEKVHDLHSFMLLRHGRVVAEGWWSPYAPEIPHMLFSLSKSFVSSAVGLAVAEGDGDSVDVGVGDSSAVGDGEAVAVGVESGPSGHNRP